jgi:hypothetical protein
MDVNNTSGRLKEKIKEMEDVLTDQLVIHSSTTIFFFFGMSAQKGESLGVITAD